MEKQRDHQKPYFEKVTIIGIGLIGGSLAINLRQKSMAGKIVAVGRGIKNLEAAKRLGVVDGFTHDVAEGVSGADLVVMAVPVMSINALLKVAAPHLKRGALVTDVGSVKGPVVIEAECALSGTGAHFVGAHPIAGTEDSGAEAAFAELFQHRKCILTPTASTDRAALQTIKRMWQEAGADVVEMDAESHDRILAAISHLPHMIAYCLVNTIAADAGEDNIHGYSAGGFMDFTRIASSSPQMWTEICLMNTEAIVKSMDELVKRIEALKGFILAHDEAALLEDFTRAKEVRDSLKGRSGKS